MMQNYLRHTQRLHNISISELVRQSVLERIEDEYDLIAYENALKEYQENSTTYSHEEVCRDVGVRLMQYKVEYTQRAVKQLKKLDKHTRKLILSWIEKKFSWSHKSKSSWKRFNCK